MRTMKKPKYTDLQIIRGFRAMMKHMDDVRITNTITGKNSLWDVSQQDWESTQFSVEEMIDILLEKLKDE